MHRFKNIARNHPVSSLSNIIHALSRSYVLFYLYFLFQETLHKIGYCTALFLIIAQQKLHKTPCKLYYSKGGHYKGQVTAYYCHKVVVKHYTKII